MAKEYIEREKLLQDIEHYHLSDGKFQHWVEIQPAADVAPVVRCKDCHLRGREECAMFYRCDCGEQHTWETDNDFCSYGEQ